MNSVIDKISLKADDIIKDNSFLFVAFENRLLIRLKSIFDKYKIPMNRDIIKKNLEENLINYMNDINSDIIYKYVRLLRNYENIMINYVKSKTDKEVIKKSTMSFVNKLSEKNKDNINESVANNFIEYMNSIIFVYDNYKLNNEIIDRVKSDIKEILGEFNRNNYNFVIESINDIIKNIIKNMWGFVYEKYIWRSA